MEQVYDEDVLVWISFSLLMLINAQTISCGSSDAPSAPLRGDRILSRAAYEFSRWQCHAIVESLSESLIKLEYGHYCERSQHAWVR
jgi:hypothetical protein